MQECTKIKNFYDIMTFMTFSETDDGRFIADENVVFLSQGLILLFENYS